MKRATKRWLALLVLFPLACTIAVAAMLGYYAHRPIELQQSPLQFSLKAGSSLKSAARQMANAGVLA